MADTTNSSTLAGIASLKGSIQRGGADTKARNVSSKATGKVGFEGLLKTFLGRDEEERKGFRTGKSRKASGASEKHSRKMDASQKRALRDSMNKTDPSEGVELTPEELAAAAEAASLIWNLLYGMQGNLPAGSPNAVGRLAGMLGHLVVRPGALGSMAGHQALDAASVEDAVETANASAEMNSAAVLATLDDLLSGLSREALARALDDAALASGVPGADNMFERLAAALDAEILEVDSNMDYLAALRGDAAVFLSGKSLAAETAGQDEGPGEIDRLIRQFLAEKSDAFAGTEEAGEGDARSLGETAASFASWLAERDNSGASKGLSVEPEGLLKALSQALGLDGGGAVGKATTFSEELISRIRENMESSLLHGEGSEAGGQGGPGEGLPGGQMGLTASGTPQSSAGGETPAAGGTTVMLDQIENIQRLAEAMRLASRGGIKNLSMQLSPPELGKVMLRVESRDGVVSAYLRVEKPDAAQELANNLQQLRENLKAQGIQLGELHIGHLGQEGAGTDFGSGRHSREAETAGTERVRQGDSGDAEEIPGEPAGWFPDDGALDLLA